MRVYWTLDARQRLQEIEAHIAKNSPQAASATAERLLRRSLVLE